MGSIDRFQILKERELKILEHWFKNDNIRRRMDAMLPLDAWYARLNKEEDDTVIMAYDGQLPAGMVSIEFVKERAYIGLIVNPLYQLQGYGKQILQKLLTDPGFTRRAGMGGKHRKRQSNQFSLLSSSGIQFGRYGA